MLRRSLPNSKRSRILAALLPLAALIVAASPLKAQYAEPRRAAEAVALPAPPPLPEARTTRHTVALPDRSLDVAATAGALAIGTASGALLADVAYVAYTIAGTDAAARPVVFAFNGGPGSASTWLHLGAMGPWRVPLSTETIAAKAAPALVPNADTWLDFADLVFIDPPGTGHSRIWPDGSVPPRASGFYRDLVTPASRGQRREGGPTRARSERAQGGTEWFWSLEGDIATFAEFIAAWLERHERTTSPVVLVGESYGGFRAPLIAETLAGAHKINVAAMVLVSPVLDFDGRRNWRTPGHFAALLPSLTATELERKGTTPSRALLAESEGYAGGEYLVDLARGPRDVAAVARAAKHIGALTGLPADAVQKRDARLSLRTYIETSPQLANSVVSIYDAGMSGLAAIGRGERGAFRDPFTAGLDPPLTAAMATLYSALEWRVERRYAMLANDVNRRWRWPNSPHPPHALSALHELHRKDARLRTLVTHGFTDLVTPYYASALQLEQLPAHGNVQRIALEVYAGGHMFYSRDGSRSRLRTNAADIVREAVGAAAKKTRSDVRETP